MTTEQAIYRGQIDSARRILVNAIENCRPNEDISYRQRELIKLINEEYNNARRGNDNIARVS